MPKLRLLIWVLNFVICNFSIHLAFELCYLSLPPLFGCLALSFVIFRLLCFRVSLVVLQGEGLHYQGTALTSSVIANNFIHNNQLYLLKSIIFVCRCVVPAVPGYAHNDIDKRIVPADATNSVTRNHSDFRIVTYAPIRSSAIVLALDILHLGLGQAFGGGSSVGNA